MAVHSRARGFTLIEMMTSLVVTTVILMAVGAAVVFTQRSYQVQAQVKSAVEGTRIATDYLERTVRMAGYGIHPAYAFDFATTNLPGTRKDNYAPTATPFVTDDLAFRFRDPSWLRRGFLNSSGNQVNLLQGNADWPETFGVNLKANQSLMLVCPGGSGWYIGRLSSGAADTDRQATIANHTGGVPAIPTTQPACVKNGSNPPYVMIVHERRVRIIQEGGSNYLVVFNSHANPATSRDFDPIAVDVENFQVAYVMNRPPPGTQFNGSAPAEPDAAGNKNWIMLDGTETALPSSTAAAPAMDSEYLSANRFTAHPSNIRAVRLSLGVRSAGRLNGVQTSQRVSLENYAWATTEMTDGFYRNTISTTVRVGNMLSRAIFVPPLRSGSSDQRDLNYDGS